MKINTSWLFVIILIPALLLAGCAPESTAVPTISPTQSPIQTATPTVTTTPNLCAPGNVQQQVALVHNLMREFDDTRDVANLTPQTQLGEMILKLSEIRRREEDVVVPSCVNDLHQSAVNYMNAVIGYLRLFMGGGDNTEIGRLIADSQSLRSFYDAERQRLNFSGTPMSIIPSPTPTAFVVTATNNTAQNLNLRDQPSLEGNVVASMKVAESAPALGVDETGKWILIEYNSQQVWVYAPFVSLNDFIEKLPKVMLTPSPTPSPIPAGTTTATNNGPKAINLRAYPDLNATVLELLKPAEGVEVLGADQGGKWILVNYAGQQLWAYAEFLTLSAELSTLPVLSPTATPTATLLPLLPTPTP